MLCHKEIRKIAKGIAGAAYEDFARDDVFHKAYPSQRDFIDRHWKNFIGHARNSLVEMLKQNYSDKIKDNIFEIIAQDRTLQAVNELASVQGTA